MSSFLLEHVVFEDIDVSRDVLHLFWIALDVPLELCHMLAGGGLFRNGERLPVNIAYRDDEELLPWLYNACMTVFRFKKFCVFQVGHHRLQLEDIDCCMRSGHLASSPGDCGRSIGWNI